MSSVSSPEDSENPAGTLRWIDESQVPHNENGDGSECSSESDNGAASPCDSDDGSEDGGNLDEEEESCSDFDDDEESYSDEEVRQVHHDRPTIREGGTAQKKPLKQPPAEPVGPSYQPDNEIVRPAISLSLFADGENVLYFPKADETVSPLPGSIKEIMKWKISKYTPRVVRNILRHTGFKLVRGGKTWVGYWGKHISADKFHLVQPWQKVNHFPMTFEIGRKDKLYANLTRLKQRYGALDFDFLPETFILPQQRRKLKRVFDHHPVWIIKPPASARGNGIRLVNKWSDVPKKKELVVSRYIREPFLIDKKKFDLRIYVLITSFEPLRLYIYREGIVRFASEPVNKKNKSQKGTTAEAQPHPLAGDPKFSTATNKWSLELLKEYFTKIGINYSLVFASIKDLVVKTVISAYSANASGVRLYVPNRAYELLGFDVLLDMNLRPWLMEVNISPSLKASCPLDEDIKSRLVQDLFNLVGFRLKDLEMCRDSQNGNKRASQWRKPNLTTQERLKHKYHTAMDKANCLATLTEDDFRILRETENEFYRSGSFERLFPSSESQKYHQYLHSLHYYDRLLHQWITSSQLDPATNLMILRKLPLPPLSYPSVKDQLLEVDMAGMMQRALRTKKQTTSSRVPVESPVKMTKFSPPLPVRGPKAVGIGSKASLSQQSSFSSLSTSSSSTLLNSSISSLSASSATSLSSTPLSSSQYLRGVLKKTRAQSKLRASQSMLRESTEPAKRISQNKYQTKAADSVPQDISMRSDDHDDCDGRDGHNPHYNHYDGNYSSLCTYESGLSLEELILAAHQAPDPSEPEIALSDMVSLSLRDCLSESTRDDSPAEPAALRDASLSLDDLSCSKPMLSVPSRLAPNGNLLKAREASQARTDIESIPTTDPYTKSSHLDLFVAPSVLRIASSTKVQHSLATATSFPAWSAGRMVVGRSVNPHPLRPEAPPPPPPSMLSGTRQFRRIGAKEKLSGARRSKRDRSSIVDIPSFPSTLQFE
ncbi:tubulin-tyrosine ligase family-domain-containing protein [Polychytrium aggregatum]|uniref:tubulin-tyrosine ligase family-domain-containing protein n=1 Tax=Polychytrium aggregatum TaxID=110093 RepID=UPI0022FF16BD|nr:tubulin-tyrosine ligase family-domain-containing protein [Polychytrium aggregatum]KAI9201853.1 tubulin-tyrosine ligase family-domain-containing protein [Polychytrium aggregatum]